MPLNARQRQTLVWAMVGALLLWALAALGPVLTPFVAGGILAYVLQPGVAWFARHRVPRALGTTLVLVTHDEKLAARCDRVLRLRAGRMVIRPDIS